MPTKRKRQQVTHPSLKSSARTTMSASNAASAVRALKSSLMSSLAPTINLAGSNGICLTFPLFYLPKSTTCYSINYFDLLRESSQSLCEAIYKGSMPAISKIVDRVRQLGQLEKSEKYCIGRYPITITLVFYLFLLCANHANRLNIEVALRALLVSGNNQGRKSANF